MVSTHRKRQIRSGLDVAIKILEKLSECTYKIQKNPNDRSLVVHFDHMKPYEGVGTPTQWLEMEEEEEESFENSSFTFEPSLLTFFSCFQNSECMNFIFIIKYLLHINMYMKLRG